MKKSIVGFSTSVFLFFVAFTFISQERAQAQYGNRNYNYSYSSRTTSSYDDVDYHHYLTGALGFMAPGYNQIIGTVNGTQQTGSFINSGLIGLGADYDYMFKKYFSFGGLFRYYNVSSTFGNRTEKDSLFTIGPQAKAYLQVNEWIPYITAGLEYLAPGYTVTTGGVTADYNITNSFGLMFGIGILYQINDTFALGIENMRLYGLTNSISGILIDDFMIKGRFAIGR